MTNTQDGKEFISYLSRIGIPNTFFEWAIKCIVTEEIPNYILKDTYNMWKHYAVSYLSDNNITTVNLNDITHVTALEIINKAVNYYKNLNEIFNDGKTTIMTIKTFHHANLLPPDLKKWCICISNKRFEEFFPDSGAFLLIKTPSLKHPYQNVVAIVNKDCVEYWDETNQRMSYYSYEQEKRLVEYEQMLSDEAVQKINHFKITENKEYKTNKNR